MHITFLNNHPYWGGLANNGGSRTILKSAEVLRKLGHRVDIVATKDRFTWFDHPHIYREMSSATDVVVAVSISDAATIIENYSKFKKYKLFYWARPWEIWQMPENRCLLTMMVMAQKGTVLCNSSWQVDVLKESNVPATLQFAGLDTDIWNTDKRIPYREIPVVCFQYSSKEIKRPKQYERMLEKLNGLAFFTAFGSKEDYESRKGMFKQYKVDYYPWPEQESLHSLYCNADIFFTGSNREGFHNPPAEAAMCGCLVACNRHPMNGMGDYADDDNALRFNTLNELRETMKTIGKNPVIYTKNVMMQAKLMQIGDREKNMKQMAEVLAK